MLPMLRYSLLILLAVSSSFVSAQIYKHRMPDGSIVYSDKPQTKGQEPAKLPGVSTISRNRSAASGDKKDDAAEKDGDKKDIVNYQELTVLTPTNNASLPFNGGVIDISLVLRPGLGEGDKIKVFLNGLPQPKTVTTTQFQLAGVNRGTNTLRVQVVTEIDTVRISSDSVIFHMKPPVTPPVQQPTPDPDNPFRPDFGGQNPNSTQFNNNPGNSFNNPQGAPDPRRFDSGDSFNQNTQNIQRQNNNPAFRPNFRNNFSVNPN